MHGLEGGSIKKDMISKMIMVTLLCMLVVAHATTWYVHPESPLNTIQAGLDSCVDDDTVLVGSGIYHENIMWPNTQGIHLISEFGSDVTIIDGDSIGSVIALTSGADSTTAIRGFTVQNGYAGAGGGVFCSNSSPSLTNITISTNTAHVGAGIYCDNSSPSIVSTTITGNIAKPPSTCDGGHGGGIYCYNNSNPKLIDVTIFGNTARPGDYGGNGYGGGIYCNNSNPCLLNVTITENAATGGGGFTCGGTAAGGGIYCENSSPLLIDVTIRGNNAYHQGCHGWAWGGGICCENSNPRLVNVTCSENIVSALNAAHVFGGGIHCENSNPVLVDCAISGNIARSPHGFRIGGGIYCYDSDPNLANVTISGNTAEYGSGGGIHCDYSSPTLTNVTISGNTADEGGGIHCFGSSLNFDSINRCNIFMNFTVSAGCDLRASDCPSMNIVLDTFTVRHPDDYFAYPMDSFTFSIFHGKVEQASQDLYISPSGSDSNSGLTADDPLLTIAHALIKILADSTNPLVIHLSNGIYSPSQTGERYPLNCRSYVSLLGENRASTLLDGEESSRILLCINDNDFSIENMIIQNGIAPQCDPRGAGVYCDHSSPCITNVTLRDNAAPDGNGGGVYCEHSSPCMTSVSIVGNTAGSGGGIFCAHFSSPSLSNVIISENTAAYFGGGIHCLSFSSPSLTNVAVSENVAIAGGGLYCFNNSNPSLLNCILWNDVPDEINVPSGFPSVTYSDIEGGWSGMGNINENPMFMPGALSSYQLSTNSPCVDAGHPEPQYNDPEDPLNPGYALWPALGTLRNDMGAYGGPGSGNWVGSEEHIEPLLTSNNLQIQPNPFRHFTDIRYEITNSRTRNSEESTTLRIYDVCGRLAKDLGQLSVIGHQSSVKWHGDDNAGRKLPSGIYFVTIDSGDYRSTKKVLLIR
jgi:hypothetical protein